MCQEEVLDQRKEQKRKGHSVVPRCVSATDKPVWTEDGSGVKLADRVIL